MARALSSDIDTGRDAFGSMSFYIGLNMVRAGACDHPEEWRTCGYHELVGKRKRYRIINQKRVRQCLRVENQNQFKDWYRATLEGKLSQDYRVRDPIWSEAIAASNSI